MRYSVKKADDLGDWNDVKKIAESYSCPIFLDSEKDTPTPSSWENLVLNVAFIPHPKRLKLVSEIVNKSHPNKFDIKNNNEFSFWWE